MVDEILYQARLHPSHTASLLSLEAVTVLHHWITYVTVTAVGVNADHRRFPQDWLFRARWGKGKKDRRDFVLVRSPLSASITSTSNSY